MERIYLVADSGGSKTIWVLLTERGETVCEFRTEGVAAVKEGILPVDEIVGKAARMLKAYDMPQAVFLSLGGPNVEEVDGVLRKYWKDIPVKVEREANGKAILFAASYLGCSAVVMCGTGSTAVGDTKEGRVFSGGWGPVYGDGGSGGGLGSTALRLYLRHVDGMEDAGAIVSLFDHLANGIDISEFNGRMELKTRALNMSRRELAALAPQIYALAEEGDSTAGRLYEEAAQEIAMLAAAVSDDRADATVLLCGGFFAVGPEFVTTCRNKFRQLSSASMYYDKSFNPVVAAQLFVLKENGVEITTELIKRIMKGERE